MTKDRDQLTPAEPEDQDKLLPRRSAAREAVDPVDDSTGPGPASHGSDPAATAELDSSEAESYR